MWRPRSARRGLVPGPATPAQKRKAAKLPPNDPGPTTTPTVTREEPQSGPAPESPSRNPRAPRPQPQGSPITSGRPDAAARTKVPTPNAPTSHRTQLGRVDPAAHLCPKAVAPIYATGTRGPARGPSTQPCRPGQACIGSATRRGHKHRWSTTRCAIAQPPQAGRRCGSALPPRWEVQYVKQLHGRASEKWEDRERKTALQ